MLKITPTNLTGRDGPEYNSQPFIQETLIDTAQSISGATVYTPWNGQCWGFTEKEPLLFRVGFCGEGLKRYLVSNFLWDDNAGKLVEDKSVIGKIIKNETGIPGGISRGIVIANDSKPFLINSTFTNMEETQICLYDFSYTGNYTIPSYLVASVYISDKVTHNDNTERFCIFSVTFTGINWPNNNDQEKSYVYKKIVVLPFNRFCYIKQNIPSGVRGPYSVVLEKINVQTFKNIIIASENISNGNASNADLNTVFGPNILTPGIEWEIIIGDDGEITKEVQQGNSCGTAHINLRSNATFDIVDNEVVFDKLYYYTMYLPEESVNNCYLHERHDFDITIEDNKYKYEAIGTEYDYINNYYHSIEATAYYVKAYDYQILMNFSGPLGSRFKAVFASIFGGSNYAAKGQTLTSLIYIESEVVTVLDEDGNPVTSVVYYFGDRSNSVDSFISTPGDCVKINNSATPQNTLNVASKVDKIILDSDQNSWSHGNDEYCAWATAVNTNPLETEMFGEDDASFNQVWMRPLLYTSMYHNHPFGSTYDPDTGNEVADRFAGF